MNVDAYRENERALWRHHGVQPKERMLELRSPRVRVRVQEIGEGPPVLFVHGGPNAGSTWAPIAARLEGHRVILLDRPGCGLSAGVSYADHDLRALAVDVIGSVLDALGLEQVDVVASSMGGLWSAWFTLASPSRVGRMVQLGAPAGTPQMKTPLFMRLMATPGVNKLMTSRPVDEPMMRQIYEQIGHGASVRDGRFSPAYWAWTVSLGRDTDTMKNELGLIEAAVTFWGMRSHARLSEEDLSRLTLPLLWIWGDADTFGGVDVLERARRATPHARVHVVQKGGHLPWLDDPETVARAIVEHLKG